MTTVIREEQGNVVKKQALEPFPEHFKVLLTSLNKHIHKHVYTKGSTLLTHTVCVSHTHTGTLTVMHTYEWIQTVTHMHKHM